MALQCLTGADPFHEEDGLASVALHGSKWALWDGPYRTLYISVHFTGRCRKQNGTASQEVELNPIHEKVLIVQKDWQSL